MNIDATTVNYEMINGDLWLLAEDVLSPDQLEILEKRYDESERLRRKIAEDKKRARLATQQYSEYKFGTDGKCKIRVYSTIAYSCIPPKFDVEIFDSSDTSKLSIMTMDDIQKLVLSNQK